MWLKTIHSNGSVPESQYLLNCTNLTQQQLETINLVRGISAIVCLLNVTLILLILLFNKAYKTILQRLFLYHVISVILVEVILVSEFEHYFRYNGQETVCEIVGFLTQYSICVGVTFINEVAMYLISVVYYSLKGVQHPLENSRCLKKTLEWIFIAIAIIFPMIYVWLPFLNNNYGISDYICWIRTVGPDCEPTGIMELAINLGFTYIASIVVIPMTAVLAVMYCRTAYQYRQVNSLKMKTLLKRTLILCCLVAVAFLLPVIVSLTFNGVSVILKHEVYALLLIDAAGIPLCMPLIPAAFLVYFFTTRNTRPNERNCHQPSRLLSCCYCKCPSRSAESEQPLVTEQCNTHPTSHPQIIPSDTYFPIEYTGAFTNITENTTTVGAHQQ